MDSDLAQEARPEEPFSNFVLTEWRLANFKSLVHEQRIALGPLTILTGANSSGKSSVIQSILLIKQTLATRSARDSCTLVLNGPLVRAGALADIVSHGDVERAAMIGFTLEYDNCQDAGGVSTMQATLVCDVEVRRPNIPPLPGQSPARSAVAPVTVMKNYVLRHEWTLDERLFSSENYYMDADDREEAVSIDQDTVRENLWSFIVSERTGAEPEGTWQEWLAGLDCTIRATASTDGSIGVGQIFKPMSIQAVPVASTERDRPAVDFIFRAHSTMNLVSEWPCATEFFLPKWWLLWDIPVLRASELVQFLVRSPEWECYGGSPLELVRERLGLRLDVALPDGFLMILRDICAETSFAQFCATVETLEGFLTELQNTDFEGRQRFAERVRAHFTDLLSSLVPHMESMTVAEDHPPQPIFARFAPSVELSVEAVKSFFNDHVYYVGPFRVEPQYAYPGIASAENYVGQKGEAAASILAVRWHEFVSFVAPPQEEIAALGEVSMDSLSRALQSWLRHLGAAHDLEVEDLGRPGYALFLRTSEDGHRHDLTHAGFGVSQVLPLLVQGLICKPGDLFIVEQPELHLHPAMQLRLADFFLSLAKRGVRCIVESHSEHFIDRLRYRVASDTTDDLRNLFQLYFIEKERGVSVFRKIEINQYGNIEDWPAGFFDQAPFEAEQILRAAIEKKKREHN